MRKYGTYCFLMVITCLLFSVGASADNSVREEFQKAKTDAYITQVEVEAIVKNVSRFREEIDIVKKKFSAAEWANIEKKAAEQWSEREGSTKTKAAQLKQWEELLLRIKKLPDSQKPSADDVQKFQTAIASIKNNMPTLVEIEKLRLAKRIAG